MDTHGKKVLVAGAGASGIAAARLLAKQGKEIVLYDGNAGLCVSDIRQDISRQTSQTMRSLLEKVVSEGGGGKAYIEGYKIGGKTATSQTLPRSAHRYISSFLCFAPADDPKVLCLVIINNPAGIYYGGTIAAPVAKELFENILPYLGIEKADVK